MQWITLAKCLSASFDRPNNLSAFHLTACEPIIPRLLEAAAPHAALLALCFKRGQSS